MIKHIKTYTDNTQTVGIDNKMSRPMTALTDIRPTNMNIKHRTHNTQNKTKRNINTYNI